ncbi:MAG: hypothetical protein CMB79_24315 [Filomicrobium sp.]|nr:hypothetical protein [Filomicrobium sp.]
MEVLLTKRRTRAAKPARNNPLSGDEHTRPDSREWRRKQLTNAKLGNAYLLDTKEGQTPTQKFAGKLDTQTSGAALYTQQIWPGSYAE